MDILEKIGKMVDRTFRKLFFTECCYGCGKEIYHKGAFCSGCREAMSVKKSFVPGRGFLDGCFVVFSYDERVRDLLRFLKFSAGGDKSIILSKLAEECYMALYSEIVAGDFVKDPFLYKVMQKNVLWTTIPTVKIRLAKRGFDIPVELFTKTARAGKKEIIQLLYRRKYTEALYAFGREERRRSVQDSFAVGANVENRDVLLMDDIFTTGSTLNEAAKVLKRQGARKVWGLCFSLSPNFNMKTALPME